jgi:hypothetical protein
MKVYVVMQRKHVDYHGCYDELINIYSKEEDAINCTNQMNEENTDYDIEYFYTIQKVI